MSTGMPAGIWLGKFGTIVRDYFGHVPYHVGSSLDRKDWRDVDVRLILPDAEFAERFGDNLSACTNRKLAAVTLAFATLGKEMTGLPIDFQIQQQTHANKAYPGVRSALFELDPPDDDPEQCQAETHSWDHFRPEQVDSYQIRCTEFGQHARHKDSHNRCAARECPYRRRSAATSSSDTRLTAP